MHRLIVALPFVLASQACALDYDVSGGYIFVGHPGEKYKTVGVSVDALTLGDYALHFGVSTWSNPEVKDWIYSLTLRTEFIDLLGLRAYAGVGYDLHSYHYADQITNWNTWHLYGESTMLDRFGVWAKYYLKAETESDDLKAVGLKVSF